LALFFATFGAKAGATGAEKLGMPLSGDAEKVLCAAAPPIAVEAPAPCKDEALLLSNGDSEAEEAESRPTDRGG
jgi:hypothetical protein